MGLQETDSRESQHEMDKTTQPTNRHSCSKAAATTQNRQTMKTNKNKDTQNIITSTIETLLDMLPQNIESKHCLDGMYLFFILLSLFAFEVFFVLSSLSVFVFSRSVSFSLSLSLILSYLSLIISLSHYLSLSLSLSLSLIISLYLFILSLLSLSLFLSLYISLSLSLFLSFFLCLSLSFFLSLSLYIYTSLVFHSHLHLSPISQPQFTELYKTLNTQECNLSFGKSCILLYNFGLH